MVGPRVGGGGIDTFRFSVTTLGSHFKTNSHGITGLACYTGKCSPSSLHFPKWRRHILNILLDGSVLVSNFTYILYCWKYPFIVWQAIYRCVKSKIWVANIQYLLLWARKRKHKHVQIKYSLQEVFIFTSFLAVSPCIPFIFKQCTAISHLNLKSYQKWTPYHRIKCRFYFTYLQSDYSSDKRFRQVTESRTQSTRNE